MNWLAAWFGAARGGPRLMLRPGGTWVATHRHRKGGLYRQITTAVLEADRSAVVIYDDADGQIWVRDKTAFEDGRFTPLDAG
jgi:hypothetical protein